MKTISIKLLLLISILFIALGCEKDDAITEVENSTILKIPTHSEKLSFAEFSNRLPKKGKQMENLNSGQLKSSTSFKVDTSNIEFKRFLDFESYTFAISSSNSAIENLLVFENTKTNKTGVFITQYDKELKLENVIRVDNNFNLDFSKVSCSWEVQEFHTPPGSSTEWSYDGTNCQHMNDDGTTECSVRYSVVVDCPETLDAGDSGGGGGTTPTPNPPSDDGGGWTGGGGGGSTPPSTDPDPEPEPEPCSESGLTNPDGSCGGALTEPILLSPFYVFTGRMNSDLKLKWNTLSDSQQNQIKAFLEANKVNNLYIGEAKAFAEEVIKMWNENSDAEVDFEDRIIDELEGKEKCLNDHLEDSGNDFVKDMLSNFQGDDSEFGINIKSEDQVIHIDDDGNPVEVNAKTTFSGNSNIINIEISTSRAQSRKALQVVRTLLHEYIHADIFRKLNTLPPSNSDLDFRDFYDSFENNNFEPTPAHETMAALYINSMKEALKSFHMTVMTGDYDYLSSLDPNNLDAFYEALAWQGLKNHSVEAWLNMPQNQKDSIDQAYQQYIFTTTNNCPN